MSFIIDIVIVVIFLLCIFDGFRKGLVGMLFSIASFVIAIILSFALFSPIANVIKENTELDENIKSTIITNFSSESTSTENNSEDLPSVIINYIEKTTNDIKNEGVETVAVSISDTCINGLSFIAIFVVARFILFIISKFVNFIAELPIIKQVNKSGGIIIGIIKGLLVIYIILAILSFVAPAFGSSPLYAMINESSIGSFMYNNNLLLQFMFKS